MIQSDMRRKKVIVIGAGASGLGAARWLTDNDVSNSLDVHVLEARDRIGGRVWTFAEEAQPSHGEALGIYDLGASWLHNPSKSNPLVQMAQVMKVPLTTTDFESELTVDLKGTKYNDREVIHQYDVFQNCLFSAVAAARLSKQQSTATAAEKDKETSLVSDIAASVLPHSHDSLSLEDILVKQLAQHSVGKSASTSWLGGRLGDWLVGQGRESIRREPDESPSQPTIHPLHHLYMSSIEFELGSPLCRCSATECVDGDWLTAEGWKHKTPNVLGSCYDTDSHSTKYVTSNKDDPLLLHTGFGRLMHGLFDGTATNDITFQGTTHRLTSSRSSSSKAALRALNVSVNTEVLAITQLPGHTTPAQSSPSDQTSDIDETHDGDNVHRCVVRWASPVTLNSPERIPAHAQEEKAYEADAVICTLPVGVLQHNCPTFSPPLSLRKQDAIANVGMGNVVKVIVEFPEVFWPMHTQFFAIADDTLVGKGSNGNHRGVCTWFLNGRKLNKHCKVLVTYGLGSGADTVDGMSDDELQELVMSRCSCFALPDRHVPSPVRILRTRWREDRWARGCYSYSTTQNTPGLRDALGMAEGAVHFAGEACCESSMYSSSVEGAYRSGVKAAVSVCKQLNIPINIPHLYT